MWLRLMRQRAPSNARGDVYLIDWSQPVKASNVVTLVESCDVPFDAGYKEPSRAMAKKLRNFRDRMIEIETSAGARKITLRSRDQQNSTRWWLEIEGEAVAEIEPDEDEQAPF